MAVKHDTRFSNEVGKKIFYEKTASEMQSLKKTHQGKTVTMIIYKTLVQLEHLL